MGLEILENLMINHGLAIRAIPKNTYSLYEARYIKDYPNGEIKYIEQFKREMLIVKNTIPHGGEFIVEIAQHTNSTVKFSGKQYYKSLDEIIEAFTN